MLRQVSSYPVEKDWEGARAPSQDGPVLAVYCKV